VTILQNQKEAPRAWVKNEIYTADTIRLSATRRSLCASAANFYDPGSAS